MKRIMAKTEAEKAEKRLADAKAARRLATTPEAIRSAKDQVALCERDVSLSRLDALVSKVEAESREFTDEEQTEHDRLAAEVDAHDAALESRATKREREAKGAEFRTRLGMGDTGTDNLGGSIRVTHEPRTYERGNGQSYFMDLFKLGAGPSAGFAGYDSAVKRLKEHAGQVAVDAVDAERRGVSASAAERYFVRQVREAINPRKDGTEPGSYIERRDLSTAAGSGGEFVPPLYLTAQYVPYARPARVFADAQTNVPLPPGTMSVNIPKVNGGTTVAPQGTQNTNVSDTDIDTEYVTFPVITIAGAQVLSLQLLERSPIAFDDVVMKDLTLAQAQQVDAQCLTGSGSGGNATGVYNTAGITTVTWTQASPTIKGLYGQLAFAKSQIAQQRFLPATHIFFTPERWEWIEQQVDSNNRPLVLPEQNGPWNVMQVAPDANTAEGLTGGRMLSCAVLQDFNIPANVNGNQDLVFVLKADDNFLYESPLVTRALPQTYGAQLSVLLQLYNYIAYTAARYPVSNVVITGTGLSTPTFNS